MSHITDLMQIINNIIESARGETPDWRQLEIKSKDLRVLAQTAMKAEKGGKFEAKEG